MASVQSIDLPRALKKLFLDRRIEEFARTSGFIELECKIQAVPFFWTLVLGFGKAASRSITSLRQSYQDLTAQALVPSSFYDRFTPILFATKLLGQPLVRFPEIQVDNSTRLARLTHQAAKLREVVGIRLPSGGGRVAGRGAGRHGGGAGRGLRVGGEAGGEVWLRQLRGEYSGGRQTVGGRKR